MGAWDYGIMDDDVARDVEITWDDYVARGRRSDPEHWSPDQIVAFFESLYLRSRALTGRDVDVATLALWALFRRDGIPFTDRLRDLLTTAASKEIAKERLALWDHPIRRKRALRAVFEDVGREPIPLPPDRLRTEVSQWAEFSKHYDRWIEISRGPFGDDEFFALVPSWFMELQDFVGRGLSHDDPNIWKPAVRYRLMCLAFYTGFLLRLPDEERRALIAAAARTEGQSFVMPSSY